MQRLPQPVYALEFAVRSGHYHLGLFEHPFEDVRAAQDRVVDRTAAVLSGGDAVLDIGCGLGGASRRLARHGFQVTGIDPCAESIGFARAMDSGAGRRADYESATLQEVAARGECRFDAAVAIEVLQHFRSLDRFLGDCAAVLRSGGLLQINDLSLALDMEWERAPCHRRGELARCARAGGWEVVRQEELTAQVLPTFAAFVRALARARRWLTVVFAGRPGGRQRIEADLDELHGYLALLQQAVRDGHLHYEATTLRRP